MNYFIRFLMNTKHDILTQKEIEAFTLDTKIQNQIEQFLQRHQEIDKQDFRILDWGCGRGKAVLTLLNKGFNAYGTDIDQKVMENAYSLFTEFGYNPENRLLPVSRLSDFPNNYFHFIFSEQVFEHVENIEEVIRGQSRLLTTGGIGCHIFPSSKMVEESHLKMPFVHWLPKNLSRKFWIVLMMLLSKKPHVQWPEAKGATFWQEVNLYYNYVNNSTFYRDNREIKKIFQQYNFDVQYHIHGTDTPKRKFLPDYLLENGFPDQEVFFVTVKK